MLKQAHAQAKAIERLVDQRAVPLLVFSRAFLTPMVSRQRGVTVLPARAVAGHLERRGTQLTEDEVEALHARLEAALTAPLVAAA